MCNFKKVFYAAITFFVATATFANISLAANEVALPPAEYKPLPEGTKVKYDTWAFEVKEIKDDKFNFVIKDTKSGDWFRFYGIFEFDGSDAHMTGNAHGWPLYSSTELDENSKSLLKKLWSLEVGKKVSYVYEETASRGKYSRKNKVSIEITGTELLQLNRFQYPTYVIKEKSSAPDFTIWGGNKISGFEFKQTYWYHPGSGLILKSTREWIKKPVIGTIRTGDYSLVSVQFPEGTTTHSLKGVQIPLPVIAKIPTPQKIAAANKEAQRVAELERKRRTEEEAQRVAEAVQKRKAKEEVKRIAEAKRKQRAKEEAQRVADAERKRKVKEDEDRKELAELKNNKSLGYLFKGSDKDILFLSNETGNAEHSIRGLDGMLVFEDDIASFCGLFGFKVDRTIRDYVSLSLNKSGAPGKLLPNALKNCGVLTKTTVDIIVFERGAFIAQSLSRIKGVVDLSLNKYFTKFLVFQFDEHQQMLVAQIKNSKDLIASVEKGEKSGFGLLLPKAKGSKVCALKDDDQDTIKQVLSNLRESDPIKLKGLSLKNIVAASLNANFIKLKKKKCRFFISSAESLKKLVAGMNRDKIKFSMHHEWGSMILAKKKPIKSTTKVAKLIKDVVKQEPKDKKRRKSGNKYSVAVIIGNKNYTDRTPSVEFAHNDADAMRKFVTAVLGYREGNIIDLRDATQAQMIAVFGNKDTHKGKLFGWVRPGKSDVTVFYSGHGVPGLKDRRGYLLPVDADPNLVEINGYPVDVLYENLANIEAKSMTVYLDACFSGDSPKGMIIRATSGISVKPKLPEKRTGLTVITAAQGDQFASWDEDAKMGLFTKNLITALEGAADKGDYGDGDGLVTVSEVQRYLDEEMSYQARRRYNREQKATVLGDMSTVLSAPQ